jgi:hypothetical protein
MVNSLHAFSYFSLIVVASLGFTGCIVQLLTVPPNVFGLLILLANCTHSDYSKERIRHALAGLTLVGSGYLILALKTNWIGRYLAVFPIACRNSAVMPFLAHRNATVSMSTATALATGITIATSNCSNIGAPVLLSQTDGPNYLMGNWTVFAMHVCILLMTVYLGVRLETSAEYRDFALGAAEQQATRTSIEGKLPDDARDSRELQPAAWQNGEKNVMKVREAARNIVEP